ncbi:EamA family transporter RarD [Kutzneria buriramensis]|uniref:Chloramphenicol-sensitive protein RarD n=1 Tax=Kutzneria buriramensis TaxID=1045776 RepID=A0A3E0IB42_9PSEU|nr:EamA family transporter RarD [Kutzneria buriramensis]REH55953.1 chloramphenicol-sensitive protein RarD [Kutzneria buriramensis]
MVATPSSQVDNPAAPDRTREGLWLGVAAYGMWGLFPLYFPILEPAGAIEILAHRMVWSLVLLAVLLLVRRRWAWVGELVRQPRRLAMLTLGAVLISINWGTYIYGVNAGDVVETSLGYFINPLLTIALGVVVLRERLGVAQWIAVGIGVVAVAVLTVGYGRPPWIALVLAVAFAAYGFLKKQVNLPGVEALAAETAVLFVPASVYLVVLQVIGVGTFLGHGVGHSVLLIGAGLVTVVPLVCFGAAAIRLPLSTVGLIQYLAPVFQFLVGILIDHEQMTATRWVGFGLVWLALAVLVADAGRRLYDSSRTN